MRPDDAIRIRHMIEAADAAQGFIAGRQRSELDTDRMLAFALMRAVEIVGEAASKISPETRAAMPSVPWSAIVATRHRLIHAYSDVNHNILWRTASEDIPALLSLLHAVVSKD